MNGILLPVDIARELHGLQRRRPIWGRWWTYAITVAGTILLMAALPKF